MKKFSMAVAIVATALMCACQAGDGEDMRTVGASKTSLENDEDSILYFQGYGDGANIKATLFSDRGFQLDSAYLDEVVRGIVDGACLDGDEKTMAYMAGVSVGFEMNNYLDKGLKTRLYGDDDSTHVLNKKSFVSGLLDALYQRKCKIEGEQYVLEQRMMGKIQQIHEETMKVKNAGYLKENQEFMKKIAKKKGVKALKDGIYYEVVTEGTGAVPTEQQTICVDYEGKTIDGNIFDSSYQRGEPIELMPTQVIPGWTKALTSMPVGSKWIVYIPYNQAYGENGYGPIKGFSTLIFTIELKKIVEDK